MTSLDRCGRENECGVRYSVKVVVVMLWLFWKPIPELRSVTRQMRSHNVTCHPAQVNAPRLNPSQIGRCSGKFVVPENYSYTQQYGLGLNLGLGLGVGLRLGLGLGLGLRLGLRLGLALVTL